jgi:hypothetical protein
MPEFVLAYHDVGKMPDSPEAGAKAMEDWKAWVSDLGDAVVNPGTPLRMSKFVSLEGVTDGSGSSPLTGFSILKADDMDAALEMAKSCPYLEMGTIEVAEVVDMK